MPQENSDEPGVACILLKFWSGCRDSNPESLVPKTRMLAVTPHPVMSAYIIIFLTYKQIKK